MVRYRDVTRCFAGARSVGVVQHVGVTANSSMVLFYDGIGVRAAIDTLAKAHASESRCSHDDDVAMTTTGTERLQLTVFDDFVYTYSQPCNTPTMIICIRPNNHRLNLSDLHKSQILRFIHKFVHCNSQLSVIFTNYFTVNKNIHCFICYNTRYSNNLHTSHFCTSYEAIYIQFKCSQPVNYEINYLKNKTKSNLKC